MNKEKLPTNIEHSADDRGSSPRVSIPDTAAAQGEIPVPDKFLKGEHNLTFRIYQSRSFQPSIAAKRSYFYMQGLGIIDAGPTYYARREGLGSYLLVLTHAGAGGLAYGGKTYSLTADEGFFIDCRSFHHYYTTSTQGWHFTFLHFDGSTLYEFFHQFQLSGSVKFSLSKNSKIPEMITSLFQAQEKPQFSTELVTSCILTNLVTELIVAGTHPGRIYQAAPRWIEEIRAYLDDHADEEITLTRLAAEFGISKFHLSREFHKHTGLAPNDYLICVRLNRSKELLKYSDFSIAQIGEMVGVPNSNHYLYLFKTREGMTPSAYRKMWRVPVRT